MDQVEPDQDLAARQYRTNDTENSVAASEPAAAASEPAAADWPNGQTKTYRYEYLFSSSMHQCMIIFNDAVFEVHAGPDLIHFFCHTTQRCDSRAKNRIKPQTTQAVEAASIKIR